MKKVCKLIDNDRKILRELTNNPEGLRVKTIIKLSQLKQRVVYKRLNLMRDMDLIENTYPIWKIVNGQSSKCAILLKDENIFELHNISYIVKLLKKPTWWAKRKNYLMRIKEWQFKNINFGKGGSNPYQQLMNENFVIQCYPESLIIIARKRYYDNNPSEKFRFNFWCDGIPHLEVRNNDFNRIGDALANHIKREKGKFLVKIDERREVYVDMSEPFGKEANYPEGQEKLEKVTKDYLIKDPMLPSEIQEVVGKAAKQIQKNAENLDYHAENMRSHVKAVQDLGAGVRELVSLIKQMKEEKR